MSTKVIKRTPDLGIGIKLQPLSAPAPDAPPAQTPCDVTGAYWAATLGTTYRADSPDFYSWVSGPTVNEFVADVEMPPYFAAADDWTYEYWRLSRVGLRMDMRYGFIGVPFGPSTGGVTWTWDWDIPEMPPSPGGEWDNEGLFGGHQTQQMGSILLVEIYPGVTPNYLDLETGWTATLTATARCGDVQVGQLVMTVGTRGY